jgi:type I restriction enzyme S subunit
VEFGMRSWKKYPKYKDSGVEWLGEIPEGWDSNKLKFLTRVKLSTVDKKIFDDEIPVLLCNYVDVYYNNMISSKLNFKEGSATRDEKRVFSLQKDDVLITKDSESWEDIAVPSYVTETLPNVLCGYHLAHIHPNQMMSGHFISYSFQTEQINNQFKIAANGITRFGLGKYWIDNSIFLQPPLPEQTAIASFLDRETTRIDALIEKKQRQIELLQEKRAALISQAVTKGLDPTVPMKDSGVPWLGEVPEHWEIAPLKVLSTEIGDGIHATPQYSDLTEFNFINGNNIGNGCINLSDTSLYVDESEYLKHFIKLNDKTVLISINGTIGNLALYHNEKVILGKSVAYINLTNRVERNFIYYLFQSLKIMYYFESTLSGTTIKNLSLESLRNTAIPHPVAIDEQNQIIALLDKKTSQIKNTIIKIQISIETLKEFRSALISAAVTGKIDVRNEATS